MTINEYLNSLPNMVGKDGKSLRDTMMSAMSIWSNNACRGYCIDAMQRTGLDEETQANVLRAMWTSFDRLTIGEAEKIGG